MWKPRLLTPLCAFTASYRGTFTFLPLLIDYEVNAYAENYTKYLLTYCMFHQTFKALIKPREIKCYQWQMMSEVCQPTYLWTCFCTSLSWSPAIAAPSSCSFIPITKMSANKCRSMMKEIIQTSFEREYFVLEKSHLLREAYKFKTVTNLNCSKKILNHLADHITRFSQLGMYRHHIRKE